MKVSDRESRSSKPVEMLVSECRMLCELQIKLKIDINIAAAIGVNYIYKLM